VRTRESSGLQVQNRNGISRLSVGVWLSLVEHLVRDEGVAGSNPATPTICATKALISRIFLQTLII
jgi:hypothetical protein